MGRLASDGSPYLRPTEPGTLAPTLKLTLKRHAYSTRLRLAALSAAHLRAAYGDARPPPSSDFLRLTFCSSQSLAYLAKVPKATLRATISPGTPSRKPSLNT